MRRTAIVLLAAGLAWIPASGRPADAPRVDGATDAPRVEPQAVEAPRVDAQPAEAPGAGAQPAKARRDDARRFGARSSQTPGSDARPAEAQRTDGLPGDGRRGRRRGESRPMESRPAESRPAEPRTAEPRPAESIPAEPAPAESRPARPGEVPVIRPEVEKAFGDRYAVLIERNIFSRNRPQRYIPAGQSASRDRGEGKATPPQPEDSMVLTGVAFRGGIYTAFIENSRTGTTVQAKVGDAVARGKVAGIKLNGVTYELEGKAVSLDLGKTLAGGSSSLPSASSTSSTKAGEKSATAAGSAATSEVLERLRQRRLQEMKK